MKDYGIQLRTATFTPTEWLADVCSHCRVATRVRRYTRVGSRRRRTSGYIDP